MNRLLIKVSLILTFSCLFIGFDSICAHNPCVARKFYKDAFACVCNETYCDDFDTIETTKRGVVTFYETRKDGLRFNKTTLTFQTEIDGSLPTTYTKTVRINKNVTYQQIIGFGGAFTDAAGINILSLPKSMGERIIKDYYSPKGLEYTIGRIPIGGSDFSTHKYTYDDVEDDTDLKHFNLTVEDIEYKIPLIQFAKKVSNNEIKLFASPWSAPAWMKTNNDLSGRGKLKGEPGQLYYKAWAKYFVKFLNAYKDNGLNIWGLTVQNEPHDGDIPFFPFNCMAFAKETERDFIKLDLGPTLSDAGYGPDKLKLMIYDDQRMFIESWCDAILGDKEAAKYVSGVAFHWYMNNLAPASNLDKVHEKHPNHFLLSSEACSGAGPFSRHVILGDWSRAEDYADDVLTDLQHWTSGWTDWNLALDEEGGPNWANNFVDAPIIVNSKSKEYYKQPMYYALGHFTKFLPPGSRHIGINEDGSWNNGLQTVAFETPNNNAIVLIALNRKDHGVTLNIHDPNSGYVSTLVEPHSIRTFIWWN